MDSLPPHVKAVVTESEQGCFVAPTTDQFIGRSLRMTGTYGLEEVALAKRLIDSSDEVLVVGAHVGTIAVSLARYCQKLVAIEANPETYRYLQCNLILNQTKNVEALNFAASDKQQNLRFVMNTHNSGGSKRVPVIAHPMYFHDNPQIVDVDAFSLDERFPQRYFSLVFMDIEGSEYFALIGMPSILRNARALFIEFLPHHLQNVAAVSPEDFAAQIAPHFDLLYVPGMNVWVEKENFSAMLRRMFDINYAQEQIVFLKQKAQARFLAGQSAG
jgi:FkbM family methyltransferase